MGHKDEEDLIKQAVTQEKDKAGKKYLLSIQQEITMLDQQIVLSVLRKKKIKEYIRSLFTFM